LVCAVLYIAHIFLIQQNTLIMAKVSIEDARLFRITGWAQSVNSETIEILQKSYNFDLSSFPYVCLENTNIKGLVTILLPESKQSIGLCWFEYVDLGK
jgi:hypothetical protein